MDRKKYLTRQRRYNESAKGQARRWRYEQSERGVAMRSAYRSSHLLQKAQYDTLRNARLAVERAHARLAIEFGEASSASPFGGSTLATQHADTERRAIFAGFLRLLDED
jgi:hypothetical protein